MTDSLIVDVPIPPDPQRRRFITHLPAIAMAGGLAASYGSFAAMAGRFLYPAKPAVTAWMFVTDVAGFPPGASISYRTPGGAPVVVTRRDDGTTGTSFLALSSTCPHLGCQVHWESQNNRFFCPCHNGTFDTAGKGTGGPPGDAGQSLPTYPLKVEKGLLYIEVPVGAAEMAVLPTCRRHAARV